MTFFQVSDHKYINSNQIAIIDFIPSKNSYLITKTNGEVIKADVFITTTAHAITDEKEI